MNSPRKPSVLFVFYTHTEQSRRVADAMASVLRERGCDVWMAGIEFTDPRYAGKFDRFPFRHAVLDLLAVLPAQMRRSTGQIRIPDTAHEGDYDLVCFGSPTWFFTTNMPLRSYLKSAEAGKVLAGKRFAAYVVCRRYWSINLKSVILRHGGEAEESVRNFRRLSDEEEASLLAFLGSLVIFPPDHTASNLDPGNPAAPSYPTRGQGSIKLTVLFNNPSDPE